MSRARVICVHSGDPRPTDALLEPNGLDGTGKGSAIEVGEVEVGAPHNEAECSLPEAVGESPHLALALFLERDVAESATRARRSANTPTPSKPWAERLVDTLVHAFQPPPHVMHAELLLVTPTGDCWHFATYLGDVANWREADQGYYGGHQWRAVPVDGSGAVLAMAQLCDQAAQRPTPYSLLRYPVATKAGSFLAPLLNDAIGAPAQCAALVARIVQQGLGARQVADEKGEGVLVESPPALRPPSPLLPHPAPRYSPSLLHNDLCARAQSIALDDDSDAHVPGATGEQEDHHAIGVLMNGNLAQLHGLDKRRRACALKSMARRVRAHLVGRAALLRDPDPYELRTLAWAAMRVASLADGKAAADCGTCNPPTLVTSERREN